MIHTVSKINKPFTFFMRVEQHKKLKVAAFYSGKTIGEILREAIDNLDVKKEKAV